MNQLKILVIGDKLSKEEYTKQMGPWSGRYASWMRGLLRSKGQVILRNLSQDSSTPQDTPENRRKIVQLLDQEKPDLCLLCGPEVSSLAGAFPWINSSERRRGEFDSIEGFLLDCAGYRTYVIPHPRDIYSQPHYYPHLLNTLEKAFSDAQEIAPEGLYKSSESLETYLGVLADLPRSSFLIFDIETPMIQKGKRVSLERLQLRSLGFATDKHCGAIAPDQFGLEIFEKFRKTILELIADSSITKVNQNIFFDLEYLDYLEIKRGSRLVLNGPVHCTKQAEVLLNPDLPLDLGAIAQRNFVLRPWKGDHHASGEALRFYNMKDVYITREIYFKQLEQLKQAGSWQFFSERRMPLYQHTFRMAREGMLIDEEKRQQYKKPVMKALEEPLAEIMALCEGVELPQPKNPKRTPSKDVFTGEMFVGTSADKKLLPPTQRVATKKDEKYGFVKGGIYTLTYEKRTLFNPQSTPQLKSVMESLKFPKVVIRQASTKKRVADSTGTDALQKILATKQLTDEQRKFLLNLIDYRTLNKALKAYYNNSLDEDGVFRFYYDNDGAKKTGRSSSRKTVRNTGGNSQNFLTRSKNITLSEYKFKNLIIPTAPNHIITTHDQSSAEAMIVAHLSSARVLLDEFKKDKPDSHLTYARFIYEYLYNQPWMDLPEDVRKNRRNETKAIGHGYHYAMAEATLQETIFKNSRVFIPIEDIKRVYQALDKLVPEVKTIWHAKMNDRIQSQVTWFSPVGRPIVFRGRATTSTLNEMLAKEPQGTIPEITNEMLGFFGELFQRYPMFEGKILQMGHDSLSCEIARDYADLYNSLFEYRASFISLDLNHGPFVVKWDGGYGETLGQSSDDKKRLKFQSAEIPSELTSFAKSHAARYTRRALNV